MTYAALSSLLLAVVACGPKSDPATPVLPDVPFEQFDHQQKIQFMKQVVVPTIGPMFQSHDPDRYAKFGCKTCHGSDVDRDEYHMPSDDLPRLNFSDMSKYKERDIEFMKNEIKPTMAKLLKEPEHSEENPRGFGCLHCHRQGT
jgi:hypothetical protein